VQRRADLADFLRARRAALHPTDVGFAPGARRRTSVLRREEVALLAGVSVSWYTWLEQGRPINASVEVLDALARTLRLDPVERDHLLALAGHPRRRPVQPGREQVPASLVHLLDALGPAPAYVLGPRWDFLAWNAAFAALYPTVAELAADDCNLVWVVFTDAGARRLIGNWEQEARRILSQFRAETVVIAGDPAVDALVARLIAASPEFAMWWPRHDVAGFETHRREFHHARAGTLVFEQQQLVPAGDPDVRVVVHLPLDDDDSAARLAATARP
jgi:transcriptional regulator with XRE-family HTH domain